MNIIEKIDKEIVFLQELKELAQKLPYYNALDYWIASSLCLNLAFDLQTLKDYLGKIQEFGFQFMMHEDLTSVLSLHKNQPDYCCVNFYAPTPSRPFNVVTIYLRTTMKGATVTKVDQGDGSWKPVISVEGKVVDVHDIVKNWGYGR